MDFKLVSKYKPSGDQAMAIEGLFDGILSGKKHQVLLGATGTGKTFTVANIIEKTNENVLVLAHNKTLASQLYEELKSFFPENRVEYFVSYYDYYQPEAYVPGKDLYIEKDLAINDEIDRLRHLATVSLLKGEKTIIVSSVSCIYGLGEPSTYRDLALSVGVGDIYSQHDFIYKLIDLQYERNDVDFKRLKFRVRGDIVEVVSSYSDTEAFRIEFFGDEIEALSIVDVLNGKRIRSIDNMVLFPASHFVTDPSKLEHVLAEIKEDMEKEVAEFTKQGKLVEAQRLEMRTKYDLEMIEEMGFVSGIENYTRYLTGKKEGEPPYTLVDYFGKEWLMIIDESHVSLPQVRAMYEGDRHRKTNLVEYGFRVRAAMDNRPLKFTEFQERLDKVIYVSATPGKYELELAGDNVVQQIIRPTGIVDPIIEVRKKENQIDDIIKEIRDVNPGKILITTLTKKMAEDLTDYLKKYSIKVAYLHSDVSTLDRIKIINSLRKDKYDVLIGINLLREGLDIPEVERVLILDADKQGFLRSTTALIQTIGRAARNSKAKVIMYADVISNNMQEAIDETDRRRSIQTQYNIDNNITPITISKSVSGLLMTDDEIESLEQAKSNKKERKNVIKDLKSEMAKAAKDMNFEKAAELRDLIYELEG